jgi:hypothetical protein
MIISRHAMATNARGAGGAQAPLPETRHEEPDQETLDIAHGQAV